MISVAAALMLLCQSESRMAQHAVVHLIAFADTEATDIGLEMWENYQSISYAFRSNLGTALKIHEDRGPCTIEEIERSINKLTVRQQDAIVFYYAGHGGHDERYGAFISPSLGKGKYKLRKDLSAKLLAKKARLTVMITDSCNNVRNPEGIYPSPQGPFKEIAYYTPLFRKLFYESQGYYELASSKKGEFSLCTPRVITGYINGQAVIKIGQSLFTQALADRLSDGERPTTWDGLVSEVRAPVAEEFQQLFPAGIVAHGAKNSPPQRTQTVVGSGKIAYRELADAEKLPLKSEVMPNEARVIPLRRLPLP